MVESPTHLYTAQVDVTGRPIYTGQKRIHLKKKIPHNAITCARKRIAVYRNKYKKWKEIKKSQTRA